MRWNVFWGGRGVKLRSVWWRCCWSCWPPASKSAPSESQIRFSLIGFVHMSCVFSVSLQTVQCLLRQEVSVSPQQPGQMQEGVHQEESGECLSFYLLPSTLSTCLSVWLSVCLQVLLARQAVRARRRLTRRLAKQRLMDARKLLKRLRRLAKEVRGHGEIGHHNDVTGWNMFWGLTSFPPPPSLSSPRRPSQMYFCGCWLEESDWLMSGSPPTPSSSHWWRSRGGGTVAESPPSTWR